MVVLPKPSKAVNIPAALKPVVVAPAHRDPEQARAETNRPVIPLPKSKPKQRLADPAREQDTGAGKALFRTAASIVVPTSTPEEVVKRVDAPLVAADKLSSWATKDKASVPEEDVDMGV